MHAGGGGRADLHSATLAGQRRQRLLPALDFSVTSGTLFAFDKMREAMACEVRQTAIGGEGKRAEVEGGYFVGYVKPANTAHGIIYIPVASYIGSTTKRRTAWAASPKSTPTSRRVSSRACVGRRSGTTTMSPGPYLIRFAQEPAWREDHRRDPTGAG